MSDFDIDVDASALLKKLEAMQKVSAEDVKQITAPAALLVKNEVNKELYSHVVNAPDWPGLKRHHAKKGPLRDEIRTNPEEQTFDGSTNVHYNANGFYYKFVDEGHFVMDNRRGRITQSNGKTIRNYHYKLKTLNVGGKEFGGYHFVEPGIENGKQPALDEMRRRFHNLLIKRNLL